MHIRTQAVAIIDTMGLFDDILKNLDDTLDAFENTVKKIDDKLNSGAVHIEKKADEAEKALHKVDTTSRKAMDILNNSEKK